MRMLVKCIVAELAKLRSYPLLILIFGILIAQFLLLFGSITSFESTYQVWVSMIDRSVSPTYLFLHISQRHFFFLYSALVIIFSGSIQYVEHSSDSWKLLINLPIQPPNIIIAKIIIAFFALLFVSALMVTMNYIGFEASKSFVPLLDHSYIPYPIWYTWWANYALFLPLSLVVMNIMAFLCGRRIIIYLIFALLFYGLASFLQATPGALILSYKASPLLNYLDILDSSIIIVNLSAVIVMIVFANYSNSILHHFQSRK